VQRTYYPPKRRVSRSQLGSNAYTPRPSIPDEEESFIHPDDMEIFKKWDTKAFELQVANHELLGHGSGKLFKENEDGTKNFGFDKEVCLMLRRVTYD
jgi:hypothetical protein